MSQRQVARHFGVHPSTVGYIVKKQHAHDTQRTIYSKKPTSPMSERDLRRIGRVFDENRWGSHEEVKNELCHIGMETSVSSVRRRMKQQGLKRCVALRKPLLTRSKIRRRLEYSKEHAQQNWRNVIFTDECSIKIDKAPKVRVTRPAGKALDPKYIAPAVRSGVPSVMVWGAIWHGGRSKLVRFDTSESEGKRKGVTAEIYLNQITKGPLIDSYRRLRTVWKGYGLPTVLEDSASVHTARKTRGAATKLGMVFLPHPPSSPDLNPIENVWAILKRRFAAVYPRPSTQDQVFAVLEKLWDELDQDMINKIIESMNKRTEACRKARGGPTKY
jgi:transposase